MVELSEEYFEYEEESECQIEDFDEINKAFNHSLKQYPKDVSVEAVSLMATRTASNNHTGYIKAHTTRPKNSRDVCKLYNNLFRIHEYRKLHTLAKSSLELFIENSMIINCMLENIKSK